MSESKYLTQEGYRKLKDELDNLLNVERPEILKKIAEARSQGDLSENAEYEAAKEEQSKLEIRIRNLKGILSAAKIIDEKNIRTDKVYILTKVTLREIEGNKKVHYQLVSSEEADISIGKISVSSPIGKALLGKAKGDMVDVQTPSGKKKFEIMLIQS